MKIMSTRLRRSVTSAALAATMLVGGAVVVAPPASASAVPGCPAMSVGRLPTAANPTRVQVILHVRCTPPRAVAAIIQYRNAPGTIVVSRTGSIIREAGQTSTTSNRPANSILEFAGPLPL